MLRVRCPCITHPFATNHTSGYPVAWSVRLACLSHAASVRSEPGSNSSIDFTDSLPRAGQADLRQWNLQLKLKRSRLHTRMFEWPPARRLATIHTKSLPGPVRTKRDDWIRPALVVAVHADPTFSRLLAHCLLVKEQCCQPIRPTSFGEVYHTSPRRQALISGRRPDQRIEV